MIQIPLSVTLFAAYLGALLAVAVHILLHKRPSRSAALWLMVITTIPLAGILLYITVGVDRVQRRLLYKEASNLHFRHAYASAPHRIDPRLEPDGNEDTEIRLRRAAEFPDLLDRMFHRPLVGGNRFRMMTTGDRVYEAMLGAIRNARDHVHLQTYIFQPDRVGRLFVETLLEKAKEGVEVRLLYDPVGSIDALAFLDELARTGVEVSPFNPLNPLKRRWQVNLRNHRKLLLVDGMKAFTGGMNISELHLVEHPLLTRVKDYHFEIQGPIVGQMQEWFIEDWHYATGRSLLSERYLPRLEPRGDEPARVITSGPDGDYEAFYRLVFAAILGARSAVQIVTPYFIPDQGLIAALRLAATRGVDITLLVPGHSDHPIVSLATQSFYEELLRAGVRIYERRAPFLHAKVLVVDHRWATIGSANMDVRSFRLNFEANVEIRSPALVAALMDAIEADMKAADMVDLAAFSLRPLRKQVLESACALLNPLL